MSTKLEVKLPMGNGWYIRVRYDMPELWRYRRNKDNLYGWFNPVSKTFCMHPDVERKVPKKYLITFKLYALNKAIHGGGIGKRI